MMNQYMEKLTKELELPAEAAQDIAGKYILPMDEESIISVFDVPPGFGLQATVCKVPEANLESYYQHVLHGNLLGQGTADAILGISDDGKNLTLSLDIDYAVSYNDFRDIIEEFFNTVEYWREETRAIQAGKRVE